MPATAFSGLFTLRLTISSAIDNLGENGPSFGMDAVHIMPLSNMRWKISRLWQRAKTRVWKACGLCTACGARGAYTRHKHTAYANDKLNWAHYCPECWAEDDAYYDGLWEEYYSGFL